ncbi:hypothetical protein KSC_109490 [Ktedonobacter sp. SOSP1-52]|uniref:TIR domain-containing protein n=1 Tax=Ktedonobacter sp. SOSP1-52 TaxID=2778366 RepID=UPI00191593CE|nr:TIR domain-containing protein [Ktedonobacter sp. SOSP1-52]GHO72057.1 hypothetical protein KSC_109490 [Ktedonobacter sp. SOSP1-52]
MTIRIFVLHAPENSACVDQIQRSCEVLGYQIWHKEQTSLLSAVTAPISSEQMIIGSAAFLLVWSRAVAQSKEVERLLLFAQRLQKTIIVLTLDATPPPTALVTEKTIALQPPYDQCMTQIAPFLPPPKSSDALQVLVEQASHEYIRERKAAIEQAAAMLQRNEQEKGVLALLEHMVQHDTITSVRDKAQEVLNLYAQTPSQLPQTPSQQTQNRHSTFGVRCRNGHVSCFDKRIVCKVTYPVPRGQIQRSGKELDELILTCTTCGEAVVAHVDCEGYK